MIAKCICEICGEVYAIVDTDTLYKPMSGKAFKSHDPFHGYPDPFHPEQDFENMRCIWGNHRPFIEMNRIKTERGYRVFKDRPVNMAKQKKSIDNKKKVIYQCNVCGKRFRTGGGLAGHRRFCKECPTETTVT